MPIQFCCTRCGEPIEVDDEHAGQTAACPYCRHMVTVPRESTYDPDAAIAARPAQAGGAASAEDGGGEAAGPLPPGLSRAGYSDRRRQAAHTLGTWALICTVLAVVLFIVYLVGAVTIIAPVVGDQISPNLDKEQISAVQAVASQHPWILAAVCGAVFFALAGLTLAIVSLTQARQRNWRAVTALTVCGVFFLCVCLGLIVNIAAFGWPGAG